MPRMKEKINAIKSMRSPRRLLVLLGEIKTRLKEIFDISSSTDPVGHYAEWLTLQVFGGKLADSASQSGYDLIDSCDRKIQVKGRVLYNPQRPRGARVREDNMGKFDYLVLVVFDSETYRVRSVLGMTHDVFVNVCRRSDDFSRRSISSDEIFLTAPGVDNLTDKFRDKE